MTVEKIDAGWQVRDHTDRLGCFATVAEAIACDALYQEMSAISEAHWCASWMDGTEEALWEAVTFGSIAWGQETLSGARVERLRRLSAGCKGWVIWGETDMSGPRWVSLATWLGMVDPRAQYVVYDEASVVTASHDALVVAYLIAQERIAILNDGRLASLRAMLDRTKESRA